MQQLMSHVFRYRIVTATVAACLLTAASAGAQGVGTAVLPLTVRVGPVSASIGFEVSAQAEFATTAGGVTLFAAYAPNGPLLARFPFLPPFVVDSDSSTPVPWNFNGIPPGTYYIALIYGVVTTTNIPDSQWTQLVVPGACTAAPGVGTVDRQVAGVEPNTVRLYMSTFGGCATSYLVEVGTTPGAANVASFESIGVLLTAGGVPPGNYYVRVRGRNQFGIGPYSPVLPLSVPGCSAQWMEIGSEMTASVVGHQVTLTWTPPTPAPVVGGPVTYYELARLNGGTPGSPPARILIPVTTTSVSTTLPSGTYAVGLYAGNTCRSDSLGSILFDVP